MSRSQFHPQARTFVAGQEMARSGVLWPWWRWAITGLSALGLTLSFYLAWHSLLGGSVLGCGGSAAQGCETVLSTPWSSLGGVLPVSVLAAGAYLAMLLASLSVGPATAAPVRRLAWRTLLVLVGAAAGSAVWFIIVQKWIIRSFCPYCMGVHVTGLALAALVTWQAPLQLADDSRELAFRASGFRVWPLVGLALAGFLAACQLGFTPPARYRSGESQNKAFAMDPHSMPLLGSPEAPTVVYLLFDYKCPHCQQLHFLLNAALQRYRGKLAFALCPTPLDRRCNPYIPGDVDEFKDSCELAKISLAVWVAKREALTAFDQWMFSFESGDRWQPRNLEAATAKAVELVGKTKLEAARRDPWIAQYMRTSLRLYAETIQNGNGAVPKLVFGSHWVTPETSDTDRLISILQRSLAVPGPAGYEDASADAQHN